jgi:septal ring factor EnvC (AmiA/AmiB activator)
MALSNKLKLTLETINTPKGKIPTASGIHNILEALIEYFKVETATSIQTLRDTMVQQMRAIITQEVENLTSGILDSIQTDLKSFRELFTEQSREIEVLERALSEIKTQLDNSNSANTEAFSQITSSIKNLDESIEVLDQKFKTFASKLAETLRALYKRALEPGD